MTFEQILELVALLAIIVFPALAVTLRLALKPIVDSILRLSEGVNNPPVGSISATDPALEPLYEEVRELRRRVADLQRAEAFYQGLLQPATDSAPERQGERNEPLVAG